MYLGFNTSVNWLDDEFFVAVAAEVERQGGKLF